MPRHPTGFGAKADELVRATAAWAFDHETELRTMPRLSFAGERANMMPTRGLTNRGGWIGELLEGLPSDVPAAARERLGSPSSSSSGPTLSSGPPT